jgi:hypothetical protein
MSTPRLVPAGAGMNASAAVLKIGGMELMFQQGDIRSLESASDVDGSHPQEGSVGWISYMRQRWPAYCLGEQLELLGGIPPSRRTCALLAVETGYVGVLCDDVTFIKQTTAKTLDVPPAMKTAGTPILSLMPYHNGLLSVSSSNRLAAHIERLLTILAE